MNIFELIFNRNYCINCSSPLKLHLYDRNDDRALYKDIEIEILDNYLRIYKAGEFEIRLDKDSKYQIYPNGASIIKAHKHPKMDCSFLTMRKSCPICNSTDIPKNLKHLLPGFRAVTELCFFEMLILFSLDSNRYHANITKDINVVYEDGFIYMVDSMRYSALITIKGPNYFLCESVPPIEIRDFKSSDDMLKYLKMIMTFS